MRNPFKAMGAFAAKALTAIRHSGRAPFMAGLLARTKFDYRKEVGTGIDASVVMAPVQWVQRAFPEARLRVVRRSGEDEKEIDGHELPALIKKPNDAYGGDHLWSATIMSYLIAGNAYWLIVRNGARRPVELWWVPWWSVEPKWPQDGSAFISHYEYKPGGTLPIRLEVEDVVHFRHGIDPENPRLGLSPLNGAIREIFMDLESSNFVASLLRNLGVPGVVISPDGGAQPAPEDVSATKKWFMENFTGDRRGDPLVMGAATKVQSFGFNPAQMDLSVASNKSEERVCACIGIPAAVVGFGAGLETAKVGATMNELRRLAWSNGVLPITRTLAAELDRSLLPAFGGGDADEVNFDTSGVVALEEDLITRMKAFDVAVRGGWGLVSDARAGAGFDVEESDKVYLRSFSTIEVPAGQQLRLPPPGTTDDEDDDDPETSALAGRWTKDGFKQDKMRPSRRQRAFVAAIERMEGPLADVFGGRLIGFFAKLARSAAAAATPLLEDEAKQSGEDEILVGRILEAMGLGDQRKAFQQIYEAHYLQVADEIAKAGELLGLGTNLPDPVARTVAAAGGRRSGLVDLDKQSRRALFDAIADGRAAGEGVEQLAARIEQHVGSGPWASPESRARTIARTETKFAQNISTVARAQDAGVQQFMVFDGRLGPDRSTPSHIARDGTIVTADQAQEMAALEHPNGTLSFSPHFEEDEDT